MKKVNFLDTTFEVPDWANYITQNQNNGNGEIIAWENCPRQIGKNFYYGDDSNPGQAMGLGYLPVNPRIQVI